MTGKIMKGIGGFYYVYVEGSGLYECRARGIFRNKKMKPNVGDVVDIDILSEEEKSQIMGNVESFYELDAAQEQDFLTNLSSEIKSAHPSDGSKCRPGACYICSS